MPIASMNSAAPFIRAFLEVSTWRISLFDMVKKMRSKDPDNYVWLWL
jgi:hypothetical protein